MPPNTMRPMRVHFTNLGCKLNQAELEALAREFAAAGHAVVGSLADADLHVVNSCTVTAAAARDSRKIARRGSRTNDRVRTVLTGCYAAAEPETAAALAGVDLVVPNRDKERLLELVHRRFPEASRAPRAAPGDTSPPCAQLAFGNSRALVKIEDGCNMTCSFCIIPSTRRRQHSRPPGDVVAEVAALADAGFHEVVITGVQISAYRQGAAGEVRLYDLVKRLLAETSIPRLRLTSLAPWRFDHRLSELLAGDRLCRHVHLSLQSGDAATLRRMRRPYTPGEFRDLVASLRRRVPGLAITTDVIAGFPGETADEFDRSLEFVRSIGFSRIHAFPYSRRAGTEADTLPDQVEDHVKRERMKRLLEAATAAERAFRHANVGAEAEVLWERRRGDTWQGTTDNYIRAYHSDPAELAGRATRARLSTLTADGMAVELVA